jgi:pimeloyl-ACP methyl ester carboxylesterase
MANFVLVHGAWHGGWCWREVAQTLRAAGHTVFTPTHTGLADKFHLSNQSITLETHIRDVCGVIEWEELTDVVLCGHSYGGMVITGVADRMPGHIRSLVYLDAFIPNDGDSLISLLKTALTAEVWPVFVNGFRDSARADNSGMMGPIPAEVFNIKPENRARVDKLCRPQSLATFECPALLTGAGKAVKRRTYILADGWDPSPFRHFAKQCEGQSDWRVVKMPSSHDVMVDMPKELADELVRAAA